MEEASCRSLALLMVDMVNRLPGGAEMSCFWADWLPKLKVRLEHFKVFLTSLPRADPGADPDPDQSVFWVWAPHRRLRVDVAVAVIFGC